MKFNWKDLFGKKRIAQLEAENKILNDLFNDRGKIISDKNALKIQKFKVNYKTRDSYLETPENREFIKYELSKKLVDELYAAIIFSSQFDEDAHTYEYTASVEVVLQ